MHRPVSLGLLCLLSAVAATSSPPAAEKPAAKDDYPTTILPLLKTYCLKCHSTKVKKGSLDLERFATSTDARKGVKAWLGVVEQVEAGEMPPKKQPQPTRAEKA